MSRVTRLNPPLTADDAPGRTSARMAVRDGATDTSAVLAAVDAEAGASGKLVMLPPGVYRVASNLTISSTVDFAPGAILRPASGVQVTLAGGVYGDCRTQMFDHSLGGVVVVRKESHYHPVWWGPVGTADDTQTWLDMVASLTASRQALLGNPFQQRIMAPVGVNRFMGVKLEYCELVAGMGSCHFVPPNGTTSGVMLETGVFTRIEGGMFYTTETTQAVTLLWMSGARCLYNNVYAATNAANSKAIRVGNGISTISPMMTNMMVRGMTAIPAAGSVGLEVDSADGEFTNVWVAQYDTGILATNAGASRWANVHSWGNNTGVAGPGWDACQVSNLYLDDNRGWGMDVTAMDRAVWNGIYASRNGEDIPGTGAIRLQRGGLVSARDSALHDVVLNDNVGHGIFVGETLNYEIDAKLSSSTTGTVTTTGVEVDAACGGLKLTLRGTAAVTPLVNNSASTILLANLDPWAAKLNSSGQPTDATLNDPRINSIRDTNGARAINVAATASAVNYLTVTNRAAGGWPRIAATGSDSNIGLYLTPKGTGRVAIEAGAGLTPTLGVSSADTNADLNLTAQGTGVVKAGGNEVMTHASMHALSAKATPIDADELALVDTEAGNALKKLTVGDVRALLRILPQGAISQWYNTTDQTTNYERARAFWSSNVFNIATDQGGSGVTRPLQLLSNSFNSAAILLNGSGTTRVNINGGSSGAGAISTSVTGGLTASSAVQTGLKVNPTINQSGTAGYTALSVDVTETGTGSGAKKLIEASVGGTPRFSVDNAGVVSAAPSASAGTAVVRAAVPASASATGIAGQIAWDTSYMYVCVAASTWVRSALATW